VHNEQMSDCIEQLPTASHISHYACCEWRSLDTFYEPNQRAYNGTDFLHWQDYALSLL
jgi:hypothetical protein